MKAIFLGGLLFAVNASGFSQPDPVPQGDDAWWTGQKENVLGSNIPPVYRCEYIVHGSNTVQWGTFSFGCPEKVRVDQDGKFIKHPKVKGVAHARPNESRDI